MDIEIKKSIKPVNYFEAIDLLESRSKNITANKEKELIWILEHPEIFTAGTSYKEDEVIDKSIDLLKTNRGGKITYHGPGQLVFYFVIDLNMRGRNIRKLILSIEDTIIETLKEFSFVIRKVLSKKVTMKFLPKIIFVKDESFDYAEKIENLIKQTHKRIE